MVHKLTLFIHLSVSLYASDKAMFLAPRVSNHNGMATPNRSYELITNHNYLVNFYYFCSTIKNVLSIQNHILFLKIYILLSILLPLGFFQLVYRNTCATPEISPWYMEGVGKIDFKYSYKKGGDVEVYSLLIPHTIPRDHPQTKNTV